MYSSSAYNEPGNWPIRETGQPIMVLYINELWRVWSKTDTILEIFHIEHGFHTEVVGILYIDVVMGAMASQITGVSFVQARIKENINAPRHWPLWGEFTGSVKIWPQIITNYGVKIWSLIPVSYKMGMSFDTFKGMTRSWPRLSCQWIICCLLTILPWF